MAGDPQLTVSVSDLVSWVMFSSSMATEELVKLRKGLSMQGVSTLPTIWPWMAVPSTVPSTSTVIPGEGEASGTEPSPCPQQSIPSCGSPPFPGRNEPAQLRYSSLHIPRG